MDQLENLTCTVCGKNQWDVGWRLSDYLCNTCHSWARRYKLALVSFKLRYEKTHNS